MFPHAMWHDQKIRVKRKKEFTSRNRWQARLSLRAILLPRPNIEGLKLISPTTEYSLFTDAQSTSKM